MRFGMMVAAVAAMVSAAPVSAAVLEKRVSFAASNFIGSAASPVSSITGSFTFTIDTQQSVSGGSLQSASLSETFPSPYTFDYDRFTDTVAIGSGQADAFGTGRDFLFQFGSASSLDRSTPSGFVYQFRNGDIFTAASVTVNDMSVPEPATWAMMLVGFASIGFAMRRRQKRAARLPA